MWGDPELLTFSCFEHFVVNDKFNIFIAFIEQYVAANYIFNEFFTYLYLVALFIILFLFYQVIFCLFLRFYLIDDNSFEKLLLIIVCFMLLSSLYDNLSKEEIILVLLIVFFITPTLYL